MRCVDIMRSELERHRLETRLPVEERRRLVQLAKAAVRNGRNPRAEISRAMFDKQRGVT